MPVNPWAGYYQGLSSLDKSLDSMEDSRLKQIQLDRQTKKDAIEEKVALSTLAEKERKAQTLRDYEEGRKVHEAQLSSAVTPTVVQNPSLMSLEDERDNVPVAPDATLAPTYGVGERPMSEREKTIERAKFATEQGNVGEAEKYGKIIALEDKQIEQVLKNADQIALSLGEEAAEKYLKEAAPSIKADPNMLSRDRGMHVTRYALEDGSSVVGVQTPDKKWVVKHVPVEKQKSPSQIDIEIAASKGDPVAIKILKDQEERKLRIAERTKQVTVNGLSVEENSAITRAVEEGRLDPNRINSRTAKIYAQMELEKPGQNFASLSADINANRGSIQWQQKNRDLMSSFVENIGKQAGRLKELTKDISISDVRLLNLPLVEFRKRVAGDPKLLKVAMYLTEISNEAARLSSGNAASIAELSLGAQERWAKIHDPYISIKDMVSLTDETYHAGKLRLETVDSTLSESKKRMHGKEKGGGSSVPSDLPSGTKSNGDGTFTLPNGQKVRKKA